MQNSKANDRELKFTSKKQDFLTLCLCYVCLNAGNEHFWALTSHYQGRNRIEIPTFPAPSQAATSVLHVGFTVNREVTQERSSFGAGASMLPPRSRGLAGSMQAAAAVAGILNPGSRHGLGGTAGRAPRALGLTPFSQRLEGSMQPSTSAVAARGTAARGVTPFSQRHDRTSQRAAAQRRIVLATPSTAGHADGTLPGDAAAVRTSSLGVATEAMAKVAAMEIMRVIDSHRGVGILGDELEMIMLEDYSLRIISAAFDLLIEEGRITQTAADLRGYIVD